MFQREDWTLFRTLGTLGQKAGVPVRHLAALVVKELADNALDAGANVKFEREDDGWIFIEDDGPGLPGGEVEMAQLFSIRRPLTSSKLVRLPSRGALGNGLRVVVGAVLASQGKMLVETKGRRYRISPQDDGFSRVLAEDCPERLVGTRIGIQLGESIPLETDVLAWAEFAAHFANVGKIYTGKTSPWWYDSEAFFEMCHAAGSRPLGDLLRMFRDINAATANELAGAREANALSRNEAEQLLVDLRMKSAEPQPSVLGRMGDAFNGYAYTHEYGSISVRGAGTGANLPFSIDVYVQALEEGEDDQITMLVNRTPITGQISVQRQKSHQLGVIGCGLRHIVDVGRKPVALICNVTTPYMPVTTDGKEPDLHRYITPLFRVIEKAAKKAKRKAAEFNGRQLSQRDVIVENLYEGISKASGEGKYRYSLRQLFYAIRPYTLEILGKEPDYNYFAQVITDIEAQEGADLPGLYRDARGVIYHPHTGEEIPLGTLNVEKYRRPEWGFNKILYSEKEGLLTILKDIKWPERNDCALMTSKGFASRAARDVIDLIGSTQEEIYFFCIHDSDASGTLIYQSLTEATRARGARKVHVINLGLDPWEATAMGLQVEVFRNEETKKSFRRLPVGDYVNEDWADWLQTQRVELNAMSSPQFIDWLDKKFEPYKDKVVPPNRVLHETIEGQTRQSVERMLAEKILAEAGFDGMVSSLMDRARNVTGALDLEGIVRDGLSAMPEARWNRPLDAEAEQIARRVLAAGAETK